MVPGSHAAPWVAVDNPDDARIADFVGLRDRDLRTRAAATGGASSSVFVAEGDPVVERALTSGATLVSLLVDATRTTPLPAGLPPNGVVYAASPEVVRAITGMGVHRGSIGVFERPADRAVSGVVADATALVAMECVTNPINMGVIVRTAAALGVDAMVIDRLSVDPYYRRASRVSMGEVFDFPFARTSRFPAGLAPLAEAGFELVALTPAPDAEPLGETRWAPDDKVALVLGAEGPGLTPETMAACHRRVRVPLAEDVDSLNVGAAAAIAFWELTRRSSA